jgi:hypothetical protein
MAQGLTPQQRSIAPLSLAKVTAAISSKGIYSKKSQRTHNKQGMVVIDEKRDTWVYDSMDR